eukprot:CAMPEP_0174752296 /NCGR_PEP_ID=MMETSP1094-20130205/101742_1 /TAXON_ID=156173 /ORGANISM="Chrysochromulina brevifilum, Strain UTEX LB 985" /LENGTH=62 /DNA_ID=CAMNT_0015957923 /DNA_START=498 /DNA_END=687 /DNA_ORIENTATION=+
MRARGGGRYLALGGAPMVTAAEVDVLTCAWDAVDGAAWPSDGIADTSLQLAVALPPCKPPSA